MSNAQIIFHYPQPIVEGGAAGGMMRPAHMLAAFRQAGYQVDVVAGYAADRYAAIQKIQQKAAAGQTYAFAYAETINKPMLLAERLHLNETGYSNRDYLRSFLRHNPWQDFRFFGWLHQKQIPLGLFCRDIYWQFSFFQQSNQLRRWFHRQLYLADWRGFRQTVNHLFVPDLKMREIVPQQWSADAVSALPPGAIVHDGVAWREQADRPLRLFYVGGVVPPRYDLKEGLAQVAHVPEVTMTLCCRPSEWGAWQSYYEPLGQIDVIHANGAALAEHYQAADLFYMVRKPVDYWQYTIPIKIFEALGYALPIVILAGTPAADFVATHDIGWVLQTADELAPLLTHLHQNRGLLAEKRANMMRIRAEHTWQQRAQTAAAKLQG